MAHRKHTSTVAVSDRSTNTVQTGKERDGHARRRRAEPAAASREADAEAGASVVPTPKRRPQPDRAIPQGDPRADDDRVSDPVAKQAHHEEALQGGVRAGPGDVGSADRPKPLDKPADYDRKSASASRLSLGLLAAAGIVLAVFLLILLAS